MAKRKGISPTIRFEILKRDNFMCQYCGVTGRESKLVIDHVYPIKHGGQNEPQNLITACQKCNIGKGARLLSNILSPLPPVLAEKDEEIRRLQIVVIKKYRTDSIQFTKLAILLYDQLKQSGLSERGCINTLKNDLENMIQGPYPHDILMQYIENWTDKIYAKNLLNKNLQKKYGYSCLRD